VDARSLAAFLGVGSFKPLSLTDPLLENLRELTRFRADLLQDRTRQLNRLQENLALAFPELASHLASFGSPTVLALLETYPGPQALVAAGEEEVGAFLRQHSRGRLGPTQGRAILQSAITTVGLLRRQRALELKLELLAQSIRALNAQLERVEGEIQELFGQLPYDPSDSPWEGFRPWQPSCPRSRTSTGSLQSSSSCPTWAGVPRPFRAAASAWSTPGGVLSLPKG
jgi:transposase